jgi:hypothetical protein
LTSNILTLFSFQVLHCFQEKSPHRKVIASNLKSRYRDRCRDRTRVIEALPSIGRYYDWPEIRVIAELRTRGEIGADDLGEVTGRTYERRRGRGPAAKEETSLGFSRVRASGSRGVRLRSPPRRSIHRRVCC